MSLIIATEHALIGLPGSGAPFDKAGLERNSAEWWLFRLDAALEQRRPDVEKFERYYDGEHPLVFATEKFREVFGGLFGEFADNWCDLVVDASVERLKIEGFRFGAEGLEGDAESWRIWQENGLDADSVVVHTEAVKCGESYLIVEPGDDPRTPRITIEHPLQVIVAYQAGSRRRRAAALKKWLDDDGVPVAFVYLPDAVYKFRAESAPRGGAPVKRWVSLDVPVQNELGVVPVVPLRNNPGLLCGGRSDLAKVIPLQNGINKLATDMIVASEFAAFRQRYATGMEAPQDAAGNPTSDLKSAVSRLWIVADPEVKFGEFSASDLGNYVKAIETFIQHVAAQTRTPPHYLLGQSGRFPSGESLKSTETGLVAKVRGKMTMFGESWEEALRLAHRLAGNTRLADEQSAETMWSDPESRTEGERVDALTKMATLGVPHEALWQRWGASPREIERWKDLQAEAEARAAIAQFSADPFEQGVPPEPGRPPAPQPAPAA